MSTTTYEKSGQPSFRVLVFFGLCVEFFVSMFRRDYHDAAFAIGLAWFLRNWPEESGWGS